jgi:hypothetical protein
MKWARNGILSDDGCAMLIERSTKKGNARTAASNWCSLGRSDKGRRRLPVQTEARE